MTVRPSILASLAALSFALCCGSSRPLHSQTPPPPPPAKARLRSAVGGFELAPSAGKGANQIGGASRDLGKPTLYAPILGKSYSPRPTFYWSGGGTGDKVTFKLIAPTGEVVYTTTTTAESLQYPADATALEPGSTYKWTIVPENDLTGGKPPLAGIQIVGGTERDETARQLSGVAVGTGSADIFIKQHDWYDAVESYSDVLKQAPTDQNVLAARALLYDELDQTAPLAKTDRAGIH